VGLLASTTLNKAAGLILARWKADLPDRLPEVEPLNTNNDREADNWMPLFTIAEMASGTWPQRAREAAKDLSKDVEDDSVKIQLLQDIKGIFEKLETDRIATSDLLEELKSLEESPWKDWSKGQGLNARHLAKLLKPFNIEPNTIRIGDDTPRGYKYTHFLDAFEAYIPSDDPNLSATSATSLNLLNLETQQNTKETENVADVSSNKNNDVALVADNSGGVKAHAPFTDDSEGEKNEAQNSKPTKPCYVCKSTDYWLKPCGECCPEWTCARCHPKPVCTIFNHN